MSAIDDVIKMIDALEADARFSSYQLHLPDEWLIKHGYDPNDYPELEGHSGYRVIEAK